MSTDKESAERSKIRPIRVIGMLVACVLMIGSCAVLCWNTGFFNAYLQKNANLHTTSYDSNELYDASVTAGQQIAMTATGAAVATTAVSQQTGTALAQTNPDPYGAGGTLVYYDPLTDKKSGYGGGLLPSDDFGCSFQDNSYHVQNNSICHLSYEPTYGDFEQFALDVQLQILKGDSGSIIFSDNSGPSLSFAMRYILTFDTSGNYELVFYYSTMPVPYRNLVLSRGWSSAFQTGSLQTNRIGLVVQGSTITWYVNSVWTGNWEIGVSHPVDYPSLHLEPSNIRGELGLGVGTDGTEVAYSMLRVWQL